jgi:hypothetical protein
VLYSADLGTLRSITVQRDRRHLAPGWHLHSIVVESSRYGGKKTAGFDTWIDSADPGPRFHLIQIPEVGKAGRRT